MKQFGQQRAENVSEDTGNDDNSRGQGANATGLLAECHTNCRGDTFGKQGYGEHIAETEPFG